MQQSIFYPLSQPQGVPLEWAEDATGVENEVVTIYPDQERERWEGFGAALTGAAGEVYAKMSPEQRKELMQMYFSPEQMGYDRVRIHMDSCDFCAEMYEADGDPDDADLSAFDFSQTERLILPMLRDAQEAAGRPLKLLLSPWSPPAYMKTNGQRCHGGSLKPEYAERWAAYICRYIQEFRNRGFVVERITLQNEPKAVQTWDSCVYTAEQEKAFLEVMWNALVRNGLQDVEIFIWDHNKERAFERAAAILDEKTRPMVAGIACHWYSGDHFENLALLRDAYPGLKVILSESCVSFNRTGAARVYTEGAVRLSHEILGDLANGATAFYDWNLLLDQRGGPNHVGNFCHAPYLFDENERELHPQLLLRYYYQFAHFLRPGSVRVALSRYTDLCDVAAYRRPDGRLAVLLLNRTEKAMPIHLRLNGSVAALRLAPHELAACLI